ncbi:MAG: DEAD/DEAH box helicase [Paludibacteraceae bacterium]|nr:DEAD/DEAH box helicase [Paludibacteraceae bacterium]
MNSKKLNFSILGTVLGAVESLLGGRKKAPVKVGVTETIVYNDKSVQDLGNHILIRNFPYKWFMSATKRYYHTTKLGHLVKPVQRSSVIVHKFFIPEIIYLLSLGTGNKRNQDLINILAGNTWVKDLAADFSTDSELDLTRIDNEMKVNLYDWQIEFINTYNTLRKRAHLNGEILSFGCGLGKTITSLALMTALGCDAVIIIAPKSTLVDVWVKHIQMFFQEEQPIYLVNQDKPKDAKFFIFNYESMNKINDVLPFLKQKSKVGIIADESHNFLKLDSLRTQNLIELRKILNCHHTLLMSGTPVKALGAEVIPLLRIIDSFFDDEAQEIFKQALGVNTTLGADILHNRMSLMMYRKKMEDVFELPPKTTETLEVSLLNGNQFTTDHVKKVLEEFNNKQVAYHNKQMPQYQKEWNNSLEYMENTPEIYEQDGWEEYQRILDYLLSHGYDRFDKEQVKQVAWLNQYEKKQIIPLLPKTIKEQFLHCRSAIKYLHMKVQGEVLGMLGRIRAQMIDDMMKSVDIKSMVDNSEKKVIFFTSYVDVVDTIKTRLDSLSISSLCIYGKTSDQSENILEEFRNNSDIKVLVATIQTLATGVTLTEANTIVFCNDPWRDSDKEQASNRIWRIGQTAPCFIYTLHLNTGKQENLSDRTADILSWSKEMTDMIVDGKTL